MIHSYTKSVSSSTDSLKRKIIYRRDERTHQLQPSIHPSFSGRLFRIIFMNLCCVGCVLIGQREHSSPVSPLRTRALRQGRTVRKVIWWQGVGGIFGSSKLTFLPVDRARHSFHCSPLHEFFFSICFLTYLSSVGGTIQRKRLQSLDAYACAWASKLFKLKTKRQIR